MWSYPSIWLFNFARSIMIANISATTLNNLGDNGSLFFFQTMQENCMCYIRRKEDAGQSPAIEYRTYKKEDQNKKQSLNKKKTA
jgi:hypothetical protein